MGLRDQNNVPLPYQMLATKAAPQQATRKNLENYDTLKRVFDTFEEELKSLDDFHAFDLTEAEGMDIKQQIKAHQIAQSILQPAWEALRNAIELVDKQYREK